MTHGRFACKCDLCGRFVAQRRPGASWSQSWRWTMSGEPDLDDPTWRCPPCTQTHGVRPSNCADPDLYSGVIPPAAPVPPQ